MTVFDHYAREMYKGPAIGGPKDGKLIVFHAPVFRLPKPVELNRYIAHYATEGGAAARSKAIECDEYYYSRLGFWRHESIDPEDAIERFCSGSDVDGWADDDA